MRSLVLICIIISFSKNVDAQIAPDKMKHFTTGAIISTSTAQLLAHRGENSNKFRSILVGIGVGCLAGLSKELYDTTGRGNPDMKDLLWTCAGSSVAGIGIVIHL